MINVVIRGKHIKIDENCLDLVTYFNSINLDTKYCCDGKNNRGIFYIMFEDYIEDKQVEEFISKYINKYNHSCLPGKFVKWCRVMCGEIKYNWMYLGLPSDAKALYNLILNYKEMNDND